MTIDEAARLAEISEKIRKLLQNPKVPLAVREKVIDLVSEIEDLCLEAKEENGEPEEVDENGFA